MKPHILPENAHEVFKVIEGKLTKGQRPREKIMLLTGTGKENGARTKKTGRRKPKRVERTIEKGKIVAGDQDKTRKRRREDTFQATHHPLPAPAPTIQRVQIAHMRGNKPRRERRREDRTRRRSTNLLLRLND